MSDLFNYIQVHVHVPFSAVQSTCTSDNFLQNMRNHSTYNVFVVCVCVSVCLCVHVNKYITYNTFSQHDPTTGECAPSDSNGGKYVMFAHATSGAQSNNDDFSPCSIEMMFPIIEDKGQGSGTFKYIYTAITL